MTPSPLRFGNLLVLFMLLPQCTAAVGMGPALVPQQLPLPLESFPTIQAAVAFDFVVDPLVVFQRHQIGVRLAAQRAGKMARFVALLVVKQAARMAVGTPTVSALVRTFFGIWAMSGGMKRVG